MCASFVCGAVEVLEGGGVRKGVGVGELVGGGSARMDDVGNARRVGRA